MMRAVYLLLFGLAWILSGCAKATGFPPTPRAKQPPSPVAALPSFAARPTPTAIVTPSPSIESDLFSKITHSTSVLYLRCNPTEIIFDVTVKNPNVTGVAFFFRMKDKATGLVNGWSNGENMRDVGNGIFEFNFRASAIPNEARYYPEAWVQYQLVGIDKSMQSLGRTQIFTEEITYRPKCP